MKFPMSKEEAVVLLGPYLSDYEKTEIQEYDVIYYFNVFIRQQNTNRGSST